MLCVLVWNWYLVGKCIMSSKISAVNWMPHGVIYTADAVNNCICS